MSTLSMVCQNLRRILNKQMFLTCEYNTESYKQYQYTLRKNCPYSELFLSAFSGIRTEYSVSFRIFCKKLYLRFLLGLWILFWCQFRGSCSQMLFKLGVLKNFAIFTGNPVNIAKFSRAAFFIEHLWWLAASVSFADVIATDVIRHLNL